MNLQPTLIIAVLVAALLVSFVELHIMFRGDALKRKYFLFLVNAVFLTVVGHLLELMGGDTRGAFSGVRVLYIGSGLASPCLLFFVADYCEIKLHMFVRIFAVAAALAYAVIAWTTDVTGLLYATMEYDAVHTFYLTYTPGSLNFALRFFPILYITVAVVMLVRGLIRTEGRLRSTLLALLISVSLPYISEIVFHVLTRLGHIRANVYITPHILSIVVAAIYYNILRYDIDADTLAAVVAIDTISEPFILLDGDLCCLSSNKAARVLFPWINPEKHGSPVYTHAEWPKELSPAVFIDKAEDVDFAEQCGSRLFSASINATHIRRGERTLWSVLIRDVTESKNFLRSLEEVAYTDTLTGLYNRRHFSDIAAPYIERARRNGTPYYFMISDIDDFKLINDVHGHLAGDAVLRGIAQAMKRALRPYDIVARWGGEEFIIIITDIGSDEHVMALADRVRREVESLACEYMDKTLRVTISSGLARNLEDSDITDMTLRADEALYAAKAGGKNCVVLWTHPENGNAPSAGRRV
ncbi:MAG: diguanylate cyclase [Oscillospiraceae bacterium]|jgi:diguanylate cyclase (GGDEF)-like protein|nr:diguanylate cyclase [Oscillospiraceae bacterium]